MGTVYYLRRSDRPRRPGLRRRRRDSVRAGPRSAAARAAAKAARSRGSSVIPFPESRTAAGRATASIRHAAHEGLRPLLIVLALGAIVFGFLGTADSVWLGRAGVLLGALGMIEAAIRARPSRARRAIVGFAALVVWALAMADGASGLLAWWALALGVSFVASARPRIERRSR